MLRILWTRSPAQQKIQFSKINQSIEESHKAIEKTAKSMKNSVESSANELSEGIVKGFGEAITNIENLQVKLFDNMENQF